MHGTAAAGAATAGPGSYATAAAPRRSASARPARPCARAPAQAANSSPGRTAALWQRMPLTAQSAGAGA